MTDTVDRVRVLTQELAGEVLAFASSIVEAFATHVVSTEENPRGGGGLAILSTDGKGFQVGAVMGSVSEVDGIRFLTNAINKNNAMQEHGVILSEKVADTGAEPPIYGGGTQPADDTYLSFSGFPPEWDQAFCLMLAEHFKLITPQRINSIIESSKDPLKARVYYMQARSFLVFYYLHEGLSTSMKT